MAERILLRRDTAANWTTANPVLANAEVGIESDTHRTKVGDGTTTWASLSYLTHSPADLDTDTAALVTAGTGSLSGALKAAIDAEALPRWKANTAYTSGALVLNPSGQIVQANSSFTSGSSYSAGNWTVVAGGGGSSLPTQTGNAGKFLTTDGTNPSWGTPAGGTTLPAAGYDIVLLAGQSNMNGYNQPSSVSTSTFDPTNEQIREWPASGTNAGQIVLSVDPLLYEDTNAAIGVGPGMAFARWYARANPTRRVLLVPAAYGGTGFASALPNTWSTTAGAGSLYLRAIARANAAIAAAQAIAPTSKLAAILWMQGENDAWANWTQSQYATALDALIDGFRSSITGASASTPFIIGRMVPDWIGTSGSGTSPAVDAAHADTPRRKAYTAVTNGPIGVNDPANTYHYLAPGARTNGERMFFALASAQANTGSATVLPDVPQKVTTTAGTTSATLGWLAAISGSAAVTSYEIWKGTAAGAETLLTTVNGTTFSYTDTAVTGGTTYYYKVRAVSAAGTGPFSAEVSAAPNVVTMLAADTFNRANTATPTANGCDLGSTDTGNKPWVYRSGYKIYISSDQALLVGATGTAESCATVDAGQADVDVQVTDNGAVGDACGVVARYVDENNYITLRPYSSTQYQLTKVVAGTTTFIAQGTGGRIDVNWATGGRLRLTVKGTTVTAYVNGTQVATATVSDSALASSTLVGMRSHGSSFTQLLDNFQVTTAP